MIYFGECREGGERGETRLWGKRILPYQNAKLIMQKTIAKGTLVVRDSIKAFRFVATEELLIACP